MKKKTRSIVVENRQYEWSVVEEEWPKGMLKVWFEGNKNKLYFHSEVSVSKPITPADVAAEIKMRVIENK